MGRGRNAAIDSLRGIAAVFVIFYHSILASSEAALSVLNSAVQDLQSPYLRMVKLLITLTSGHNAVLLFFVLSGFVLMLSMDKDHNRGEWSVVSFIVRRFMRLYPALIAALAICFAVGMAAVKMGWQASYFVSASDPVTTLQNMLLWKIGMHGATWTIQVEVLAIPFLLVGFWMARFFGIAGLVACLIVAILETQSPFITAFSPPLSGSLLAFYAGMVAAKLLSGRPNTSDHGAAIVLMAVLYTFISLFAPLDSNVLLSAQVLACTGLIVCVFSSRDCAAIRFLNSGSLVKLGRISYSLYLLNVPVLWVVFSAAQELTISQRWPVVSGLLVGVVTTMITIPIADGFERAIERPANALGKRLTTRSRPTVEAAAE